MYLIGNSLYGNEYVGAKDLEEQIPTEAAQKITDILESGTMIVSLTDSRTVNDEQYGDRTQEIAKENQKEQVFKEKMQHVIESLYAQLIEVLMKQERDVFYTQELVKNAYDTFTSKQKIDDFFYTLKRNDSLNDDDMYNYLKAIFETELKQAKIQSMRDQIRIVK